MADTVFCMRVESGRKRGEGVKSYPKKWGKLFERYLDEYLPERKDEICARADREYRKLLTQMPDVGGKENMMASNMETWFSIVAFYEASDHVIDGKAFETIYEWHIDPLRFLGKIIDANRSKWVYKLFGIIYDRYEKQLREHQAKGEWKDSWGIAVNPENHKEGYSFHLIGCPIAKHAKENGYEELLPHLCRTDHVLAEVLHARLIRTQTEILGGPYCDYWYVGDRFVTGDGPNVI